MNKENNYGAAGLRRSAIAERKRLQEEWSALKGTDTQSDVIGKRKKNVLKKRPDNVHTAYDNKYTDNNALGAKLGTVHRRLTRGNSSTSEALRGVVALVEVGTGSRALALRAALTALGATVVPTWSPLVTHLVWSHDGCRSTRAKARALACRLVSPLWVEACAASGRRLSENTFPAASRPSDLPSPRTLRLLLKKAEMENISLANLLTDSTEEDDSKKLTLCMSSDSNTDTSANTSANTSRDKTDIEMRVNTAPRRPPQSSRKSQTQPPKKSKRKLYTQKDPDLTKGSDNASDSDRTPARQRQLTYQERRQLARAERMARRLVRARSDTPTARAHTAAADTHTYRVILTGMSRSERIAVHNAVRALNGRIQTKVNKTTTHVLLGSCRDDTDIQDNLHITNNEKNTINIHKNRANELQKELTAKSIMACLEEMGLKSNMTSNNISGVDIIKDLTTVDNVVEIDSMAENDNIANVDNVAEVGNMAEDVALTDTAARLGNSDSKTEKLRTVNALLGAARGCRVLYAKWALDSLEAKRWLHHYGYEVPHLRKIALKARVERQALGRMRSAYAYDVFNGMRVRISPNAEKRDAVTQLLSLCGAVVQNGGNTQNGVATQNVNAYDIIIGVEEDEVSSKWVFDSVAAARMRTTRRYINKNARDLSEFHTQ